MPWVCRGIAQALARALWLSPCGCSVARVFFYFYDLISHPSIPFATYNSICRGSICAFDFMFTRFNRVRGLARERFAITWGTPSACQGIALSRACHGIAKELPRDFRASALRFPRDCLYCLRPMDCLWIALGSKGVALGLCRDILRAFSIDCQGVMSRSNIRKYHGFRQRKFWICFAF